eukprot:4013225-Prorocentrum_lima.AAC.1
MTSSLVGSEMCIRDRGREDPRDRGKGEKRLTRKKNNISSLPDSVREEAVSYTHLTLPTICSV